MLLVSQIAVAAFAVWLIGVGLLCLMLPQKALTGLSKFASTNLINYTELILRLIVGLGFIGIADVSKYPAIFVFTGIFLVFTAIILMIIPRRWHAGYSVYWSKKIPISSVRWLVGPIAIFFAMIIFWAVIQMA